MSARSRLIISLLAIVLSIVGVVTKDTNLGLDLKGGTQVTLDLKARGETELNSDLATRTVEVMRNRIDSLGVSEPSIQTSGNNRVIIDLPGAKNREEALSVIGSTARLTVHPVTKELPPTTESSPADADQMGTLVAKHESSGKVYELAPAVLDGSGIKTAESLAPSPNAAGWRVGITFKGDGKTAWTKLTGEEACKPQSDPSRMSAFVLDGRIIEVSGPAPEVQCGVGITGEATEIRGSFTMEETRTIALLIRGGALPVDVNVVSSRYIGPELGEAAIKASVLAIIIGGILTIIYMLGYYRMLGLVAGVALAAYALLSFAALLGIGITLTLPGIAGFVLAVAMAMDSNILVYERVKEEYDAGRSLKQSARLGFKNALSAIWDSNITTFIVAAVLFFFSVGEVKGFGVTLLLGTAVSIFVTLVILRSLVEGLLATKFLHDRPKALGMFVGSKFRKRMTDNPPDLMGYSKWFLAITGSMAVIALAGIAVNGINYGLEFSGGRTVEFRTEKPVEIEKARDVVSGLGIVSATVQHTGASEALAKENVSIRAKSITDEQANEIQTKLGEIGGSVERVGDNNIGPSFSNELKRKAIIGLVLGVAAQLLFMAWRFRWTFGIGAVVALIHDAAIVLGIFAWMGKEFNAIFLASILTVIAFSINDTVVVFDRIREHRRRRSAEEFRHVVSDACAQTLPRTINLSMSAVFILAALYFFGGDTLSDFSLALLIGVVVGVYSSIMVAAPVCVILERWKPTLSAGHSQKSNAKPSRDVKSTFDGTVNGTETNTLTNTSEEGTSTSSTSSATSTTASSTTIRPAPRKKKRR